MSFPSLKSLLGVKSYILWLDKYPQKDIYIVIEFCTPKLYTNALDVSNFELSKLNVQ